MGVLVLLEMPLSRLARVTEQTDRNCSTAILLDLGMFQIVGSAVERSDIETAGFNSYTRQYWQPIRPGYSVPTYMKLMLK